MLTIEKETCIKFIEKKSKFIGYIKPISSKKEAEEFINSIKKRHKDASHNVPVYRVMENGQEYFKFDDDGEPSGTSGKPMAEILNLKDVYNVALVATRYFGGVKLGAGGLVRNYAKTAKLSVEEAGIIKYIEKKSIILDFDYSKTDIVDRILKSFEINEIIKEYQEKVVYRLDVSKDCIEELAKINGIVII